jgi:hypothetical protein
MACGVCLKQRQHLLLFSFESYPFNHLDNTIWITYTAYTTYTIAQLVQWRTASLTAEVRFPTRDFSLFHSDETGSGVHPASYPVGIVGSFLWCKADRAWTEHSSPSSVEVELYLHSIIRLHGTGTNLPLPLNPTHIYQNTILTTHFRSQWVHELPVTQDYGVRVMDPSNCIVAYRPVAKQWLCKHRPLLGNVRNIHPRTIQERRFVCGPRRDCCYATTK